MKPEFGYVCHLHFQESEDKWISISNCIKNLHVHDFDTKESKILTKDKIEPK